jgi:hypothetical protein
MVKATNKGTLNPIDLCYIDIPISGSLHRIKLNNLPDLSDTKSAVYNNEAILGRSFPLYTYSHSADRQINMQLHFFAVDKGDIINNIKDLRAIQSAVYPREGENGSPYLPPPVCLIQCGALLSGNPSFENPTDDLCVVLQSYSVKFPTEVAWEEEFYVPYRFDIETSWLTVYTSEDLPFQERIYQSGR